MTDSIEAITKKIEGFYQILSGRTDSVRDWENFKSLFTPDAVLTIRRKDADGNTLVSAFTVERYIQNLKNFLSTRDFFEFPQENDVRIFGEIACVVNRYEAFGDSGKQEFIKRGTNLVNLVFDGSDWKISGMLWQDDPA